MTDFEVRAKGLLPDYVWSYYSATAGDGIEAEGIADWSAIRFRPYVLRDVSWVDTKTSVLGTQVRTPILIAPMAQQVAAHPDGEAAMARAAAAEGGLLGVSTNAAVPFASVAAEGAPWWFQVYVARDRHLTERLVKRAVQHGAAALLLTVDMATLFGGSVNPRNWADGPGKARLGNLTADELAAAEPDGKFTDRTVGFEVIEWLRKLSDLPIVVKGVLRGDDGLRCVDAGAAGILVSTHGGRRLGSSISSATALPEVVAEVGARAEIYVDSGLRSGEHVAAALAMGARAVFVGRPALWALAAAGAEGVRTALSGLTAELALVMKQLGVSRLDQLTEDLLAGP